MTFAWYAHLKNFNHKAWYVAALLSWVIALFEYLLQVPANRIGYTSMTSRTVETVARDYYAVGIRAVCRVLHAAAVEAGLSVGRTLFIGRCLFYVSQRMKRIRRSS